MATPTSCPTSGVTSGSTSGSEETSCCISSPIFGPELTSCTTSWVAEGSGESMGNFLGVNGRRLDRTSLSMVSILCWMVLAEGGEDLGVTDDSGERGVSSAEKSGGQG